jgi:hypothetical protein
MHSALDATSGRVSSDAIQHTLRSFPKLPEDLAIRLLAHFGVPLQFQLELVARYVALENVYVALYDPGNAPFIRG